MLATYHNHSRWSDGKATIEEIIDVGRLMNIAELGISDHWVLHPRGIQQPWAMPTGKLADYVAAIAALRDDVDGGARASRQGRPQLRLGLEVDWFPGHSAPLGAMLEKFAFDYLIGSVHEVQLAGLGDFMIDMSPAAWEKLSQAQRNAIHQQYWINLKSMAESGLFDIAAHLDLPKKFGFYPTIDLSNEVNAALDAIAAAPNDLVIELNTSGWHKPCADAYPTLEILRECRRRNIKVTLSADAHQPNHLLRDFDRGAARLSEAGYTHVARFKRRRVRLEPLSEAVV